MASLDFRLFVADMYRSAYYWTELDLLYQSSELCMRRLLSGQGVRETALGFFIQVVGSARHEACWKTLYQSHSVSFESHRSLSCSLVNASRPRCRFSLAGKAQTLRCHSALLSFLQSLRMSSELQSTWSRFSHPGPIESYSIWVSHGYTHCIVLAASLSIAR